ncbi:response regulator transcription factor [Leifsonia sp. SIMBA_070]|uniref:response regulator transcription factor n=1 Tax=Leifsonia sp. SIMBA_070 TaxID=3085810 RepID=UPI00397D8861
MTDHRQPGEEWIAAQDLRQAVIDASRRGDIPAATELIRRHWDRYAGAEPAHLLAAIRALPGEALLDNAALVVAADYLQHVANQGEPHRFESDRRALGPAGLGGPLQQQLVVLTSIAASERTTGGYRRAVDAAQDARRRLSRASNREAAAMTSDLPHLFLQWARALEVAEEPGLDVQFEYEEAYRLALASQQPQVGRRAAGHLAWYHARRGRLRAAQQWLRRARETGTPVPRYEAVTHLAAALIHLDHRNQKDSALELARMSAYPIGEYWSAALWVRAWHATTPAERALLETEIGAELDRHPSALMDGGSHRLLVRAAWLRLGHPIEPVPSTHHADHMLMASFEYRRGDYRAAIASAEPATTALVPPRTRSAALVISSAAALGLQRASVAEHHFEVARALIDSEGLYSAYDHISREHLHALIGDSGDPIPHQLDRRDGGHTSPALADLTRREREVLLLLPSDRTIPEIAAELYVSPNTVKGALRRLYRKLGVASREAAADIAERARLFGG